MTYHDESVWLDRRSGPAHAQHRQFDGWTACGERFVAEPRRVSALACLVWRVPFCGCVPAALSRPLKDRVSA